ncbi:hypothetical protein DFH09DRAFT_1080456 [Mycena vulgaris]|nr:hypothetical protein DFH09DRAFT_1080456 [Mycena vulgaris]
MWWYVPGYVPANCPYGTYSTLCVRSDVVKKSGNARNRTCALMDVALPKPTASPEQVRVGCPSKCPQVAIMTSAIMLAPCVPKVVEPVTLVVHSAEEIMSVGEIRDERV